MPRRKKQSRAFQKWLEAQDEAFQIWWQGAECEENGDIKRAIRLYTKAAKLGEPLAQSNLGNLLDDKVSPNRPSEAVYLYKRAIKSGNENAAWNLAMHYRNLGTERWYKYWLRVAADMGEKEALKICRRIDRHSKTPEKVSRRKR